MQVPSFKLWLEFEHWQSSLEDDPYDDIFNMQIELVDGAKYALNVWTFRALERAKNDPDEFGVAELVGKYCRAPDLFVERLDRPLIEQVVADLINVHGLLDHWLVADQEDGEITT